MTPDHEPVNSIPHLQTSIEGSGYRPQQIRRIDQGATILHHPDEILGLALSFLGAGQFGFIAPVCSRFKYVYLTTVSDEKITNGECITSSISRAEKYFEDAGTNTKQLIFFWYNVSTRYGHVDVMEWAHTQGHSRVWNAQFLRG